MGPFELVILSAIIALIVFVFSLMGGQVSSKSASSKASCSDGTEADFCNKVDELKELKDLLDKNIIAQEEYEARKKEILNR